MKDQQDLEVEDIAGLAFVGLSFMFVLIMLAALIKIIFIG
jgi:hypothetical protein